MGSCQSLEIPNAAAAQLQPAAGQSKTTRSASPGNVAPPFELKGPTLKQTSKTSIHPELGKVTAGTNNSPPASQAPTSPVPAPMQPKAVPDPTACQTKGTRRESSSNRKPPTPSITARILQDATDVYADYEFDKILGKGNFGVVSLVKHKVTGEALACKSISKRKLVTPQDVEEVRREVQIMNHLAGHPNVTNLRATYEDRNEVHLLMDVCTGGELFDKIAGEGCFSEKAAAEIMRTIVRVVHHCHTMNVIHRDLKPENFLLSSKLPGAQLQATDFGLSRFFRDGEYLNEIVGSPYYVAPEVLQRKYGKNADIWSCGVILYILLCGAPPFKGDSSQAIFRNVLTAPVDLQSGPWQTISDAAKDVVRKMLQRDPKRRVTAEQVLSHPWMRENGVASDAAMVPEVLLRMRQFSRMNKLKKEAYKIIASSLPTTEIVGMKQMFEDIDKDCSGNITVDELRLGLRHKGADLAVMEVQRIVDDIDINGNSKIDYEEFLAATTHINKLNREDNMIAAFKHFDLDASGYITRDELQVALSSLGEIDAVVDAVLQEVDSNGDGKIDYEEFCAMMKATDMGVLRDAAAALRSHILTQPKMTASFQGDLDCDFAADASLPPPFPLVQSQCLTPNSAPAGGSLHLTTPPASLPPHLAGSLLPAQVNRPHTSPAPGCVDGDPCSSLLAPTTAESACCSSPLDAKPVLPQASTAVGASPAAPPSLGPAEEVPCSPPPDYDVRLRPTTMQAMTQLLRPHQLTPQSPLPGALPTPSPLAGQESPQERGKALDPPGQQTQDGDGQLGLAGRGGQDCQAKGPREGPRSDAGGGVSTPPSPICVHPPAARGALLRLDSQGEGDGRVQAGFKDLTFQPSRPATERLLAVTVGGVASPPHLATAAVSGATLPRCSSQQLLAPLSRSPSHHIPAPLSRSSSHQLLVAAVAQGASHPASPRALPPAPRRSQDVLPYLLHVPAHLASCLVPELPATSRPFDEPRSPGLLSRPLSLPVLASCSETTAPNPLACPSRGCPPSPSHEAALPHLPHHPLLPLLPGTSLKPDQGSACATDIAAAAVQEHLPKLEPTSRSVPVARCVSAAAALLLAQ